MFLFSKLFWLAMQSVRDAQLSGKMHEVQLQRNEVSYVNSIDPDLLLDIIRLSTDTYSSSGPLNQGNHAKGFVASGWRQCYC